MNYLSYLNLGKEGFVDVITKINYFRDAVDRFPESINELETIFSLTDTELNVLEHRGKLEKKLHKISKPRLILLQMFDKKDDGAYLSDNNQLIYTEPYEFIGEDKNQSDDSLGLHAVNKDVDAFRKNHGNRGLSTNARILYVRPGKLIRQLIKPSCGPHIHNNTGTLSAPIYQIEAVLDNKKDILSYCKKKGLRRGNLKIIENLFDADIKGFMLRVHCSKVGFTSYEAGIVVNNAKSGVRTYPEVSC
ncbi:MAG TPA: hypothetical protein ENG87_04930 [Candidatus Pacearchaeota archaeon]|nr:hypothetical protein [Candidatus Pacearchaeota archaeon]HDZ61301.1 hypothetical protein [Candidatus Pacearchaeota archaeon]